MAIPALYNTIATAFRDASTNAELRNATFWSARLLVGDYFKQPQFNTSEAGPLQLAISVPNQAAIPAEETCIFVAKESTTGFSRAVLLAVNADSDMTGVFDAVQPRLAERILAEAGGPAFGIMMVRSKIVFVNPNGQRMGPM